jgi:predicted Fe-S protein YdhL (DUF1289 family)
MRATPCIGICSTTYGDLVCRGCKRFAHEIVAWNTYAPTQRERIWQRLLELRDQATARFVAVADERALREVARALRIDTGTGITALSLGYEVLRRKARDITDVREVGLEALSGDRRTAVELRDAIDAEFLVRSVAHYEHSFRVPVDS